jgi:hypothetical protein
MVSFPSFREGIIIRTIIQKVFHAIGRSCNLLSFSFEFEVVRNQIREGRGGERASERRVSLVAELVEE